MGKDMYKHLAAILDLMPLIARHPKELPIIGSAIDPSVPKDLADIVIDASYSSGIGVCITISGNVYVYNSSANKWELDYQPFGTAIKSNDIIDIAMNAALSNFKGFMGI